MASCCHLSGAMYTATNQSGYHEELLMLCIYDKDLEHAVCGLARPCKCLPPIHHAVGLLCVGGLSTGDNTKYT